MFWDYGRPSGRWEIWVSAASSYLLNIYLSISQEEQDMAPVLKGW